MANKKTAVEWLEDTIERISVGKIDAGRYKEMILALVKEAKEMEKQQMKTAVMHNVTSHPGIIKIFEKQFEEYYQKTFEK